MYHTVNGHLILSVFVKGNKTPLEYAVEIGFKTVARLLLEADADPKKRE